MIDNRADRPFRIFQIDQGCFNRIQFNAKLVGKLRNIVFRDESVFRKQGAQGILRRSTALGRIRGQAFHSGFKLGLGSFGIRL